MHMIMINKIWLKIFLIQRNKLQKEIENFQPIKISQKRIALMFRLIEKFKTKDL